MAFFLQHEKEHQVQQTFHYKAKLVRQQLYLMAKQAEQLKHSKQLLQTVLLVIKHILTVLMQVTNSYLTEYKDKLDYIELVDEISYQQFQLILRA